MLRYELGESPDFDYLVGQLENPTPLLRAFAAYRRSQFNQSISLGLDPYGKPIAPLSKMYAIQKERKHGRKAIRYASGKTVKLYRQGIVGRALMEEIPSEVAVHLQHGTKKMTARPLLPDDRGLPPRDQEKLLELSIDYVERSI